VKKSYIIAGGFVFGSVYFAAKMAAAKGLVETK